MSNALEEAKRLADQAAADKTVFIPLRVLQALISEVERLQPPRDVERQLREVK